MSTASPHVESARPEKARLSSRIVMRDMWASLAISVMWLAVLFDALFGPDFVTSTVTTATRIPSALFVALFAYLGTRVVARYGFGRGGDDQ